jgi:hypothetical protein
VNDFDRAVKLMRQAIDGEPGVGLAATIELRAFIDLLQVRQVRRARRAGLSWRQIARGFGHSVSATHERFVAFDEPQWGRETVRPPQHRWTMADNADAEW